LRRQKSQHRKEGREKRHEAQKVGIPDPVSSTGQALIRYPEVSLMIVFFWIPRLARGMTVGGEGDTSGRLQGSQGREGQQRIVEN